MFYRFYGFYPTVLYVRLHPCSCIIYLYTIIRYSVNGNYSYNGHWPCPDTSATTAWERNLDSLRCTKHYRLYTTITNRIIDEVHTYCWNTVRVRRKVERNCGLVELISMSILKCSLLNVWNLTVLYVATTRIWIWWFIVNRNRTVKKLW